LHADFCLGEWLSDQAMAGRAEAYLMVSVVNLSQSADTEPFLSEKDAQVETHCLVGFPQ
jgi:hypothetical protein